MIPATLLSLLVADGTGVLTTAWSDQVCVADLARSIFGAWASLAARHGLMVILQMNP